MTVRTTALDFPKSILIETCSLCQGACHFCPYRKLRRGTAVSYLTETVFMRLIEEISQHFVERITLYCNNEPLLDERMPQFVWMAKKANPNSSIVLSTNGRLLTREKAVALYDAGLDDLFISIPTLDDADYQQLMAYPLRPILQTIEEISKTPAQKMIRIGIPETKYLALEKMRAYFAPRGIPIYSWPLEYKVSWGLMDYEGVRFSGLNREWKRCDRPMDQACILADGSMVLCCRDWRAECVIGNVYDNSIQQLWQSAKMQAIQTKIAGGEYDQIQVCKDCSENPSNRCYTNRQFHGGE